jgi:hypothetical protein
VSKEDEMKPFWLVKYCLSKGTIVQIPCRASMSQDKEYVVHKIGYAHGFYKIGKDVFESEDDAMRAADELRIRKIASVKKQLKKLENMKFLRVQAKA